jgi:hypothetical protein
MSKHVAFLRVAGQPTGEEVKELKDAVDSALSEEWGVVVYTGEAKFTDVDEFERVLKDTLRQLKDEDHRLANAEPAEQPAEPPWEEDNEA